MFAGADAVLSRLEQACQLAVAAEGHVKANAADGDAKLMFAIDSNTSAPLASVALFATNIDGVAQQASVTWDSRHVPQIGVAGVGMCHDSCCGVGTLLMSINLFAFRRQRWCRHAGRCKVRSHTLYRLCTLIETFVTRGAGIYSQSVGTESQVAQAKRDDVRKFLSEIIPRAVIVKPEATKQVFFGAFVAKMLIGIVG